MFSSATITSVGLTLSALLLSATATPLQARDEAFSVSCDSIDIPEDRPEHVRSGYYNLQSWCTSRAVSLVCSPQGNMIAAPGVNALSDSRCNEHCRCSPAGPPPTAPLGEPSSLPVPSPPGVLTCTGNVKLNPNLEGPPKSPVSNQDYCTSELVTTVCEDGKPVVKGIDNYDACAKICSC